jgi:hypothetical protein
MSGRMMKASVVAAVLAPTVLAVAPAAAKELTRVELCGRGDECAVIADRGDRRRVPMGGATSVAAPPPRPFYRMILTIQHGDQADPFLLYYVPSEELLAANAAEPGEMVWLPIADAQGREVLRQATQGLDPLPAPAAWPRRLASDYRVIPDDQLPAGGVVAPSSPAPETTASADEGGSAVWLGGLAAAAAVGLTGLAALVFGKRSQANRTGRAPR